MADRQKDVEYLNRFLETAWPGLADIAGCELTHQTIERSAGMPGRMSRRRTRAHLKRVPRVSLDGAEGLRLRIPGDGELGLSSRVFLLPWVPLPRINFHAGLWLDMPLNASGGAEPDIHVDVRSNLTGRVASRAVDWMSRLERELSGKELGSEIGYFAGARYAPGDVPVIPPPMQVDPDSDRLKVGINIVLVPESFSTDRLPEFDRAVDEMVDTVRNGDSGRASEPFNSFRSAISFWTIKPDQSPDGDHIMGMFRDPRGKRRVALANLARLAAIGRSAGTIGGAKTILVFVVDPAAPRFEGQRPPAMALGDVVIQSLQSTASDNAYLLLHELGHTSIARLGDEYVLGARREKTYLGWEPDAVNLTADPSLRKWDRWLGQQSVLPEWDRSAIIGAEGGGYFGHGMWRPAESCAMRQSTAGVPFCAVCREALTLGIRDSLGAEQLRLRQEWSTSEVDYIDCSTRDPSGAMRTQVSVPGESSDSFTVELVAATLPEPWDVSASLVDSSGTARSLEQITSDSERPAFSMNPSPGDHLELAVESKCLFTPWDRLPRLNVQVDFIQVDS